MAASTMKIAALISICEFYGIEPTPPNGGFWLGGYGRKDKFVGDCLGVTFQMGGMLGRPSELLENKYVSFFDVYGAEHIRTDLIALRAY